MDLDLSEEQKMLRTTVGDFLAKECPKTLVREMVKDEKGYLPELWQKMADLGWHGLALPQKYGGSGAPFLNLIILLEETGRACLPGPFFSTVILGAYPVLDAGSQEQKQTILPKINSGELILTLALTEPSASFTAEGITLPAILRNNSFILDGTKLFVPDAHICDYIICAARTTNGTNKNQGVTLFLVDAKSPGIKCTLLKTVAGDKQCEVIFDKVEIPRGNILGKQDKGWAIIEKILERAAVAKCAEMVGGMQQVLDMTVDYAKQRVQFGSPIGSFQAVQHHCVNMLTDVEASRCITYEAAWKVSEGLPARMEVAIAKAWVSEAYQRVTALGHQVHGGIGFCEDHDMSLYFKRAKAAELAFGDANFYRGVVGQRLAVES